MSDLSNERILPREFTDALNAYARECAAFGKGEKDTSLLETRARLEEIVTSYLLQGKVEYPSRPWSSMGGCGEPI